MSTMCVGKLYCFDFSFHRFYWR